MEPENELTESERRARNKAARAAYEDAALQGLCEEGRLEAAEAARKRFSASNVSQRLAKGDED